VRGGGFGMRTEEIGYGWRGRPCIPSRESGESHCGPRALQHALRIDGFL